MRKTLNGHSFENTTNCYIFFMFDGDKIQTLSFNKKNMEVDKLRQLCRICFFLNSIQTSMGNKSGIIFF